MSSAYVANSSFGRLVMSEAGSANAIHLNEFARSLTTSLDNVKLDDILASGAMIKGCGAQGHQIPDDGDLTRLVHAPNNDTMSIIIWRWIEPRDGLGPALTVESGEGNLVGVGGVVSSALVAGEGDDHVVECAVKAGHCCFGCCGLRGRLWCLVGHVGKRQMRECVVQSWTYRSSISFTSILVRQSTDSLVLAA
ncbi:hypothetical protein AUEXF2481DRAFT_540288 [Aureobasidium subglaciale EXF-2481]|uniref:Uncharacterized protein n=1 Tax=Aureobasidium subglaciale (strain EXF-2481) TaxID=1043005 RepID=A0A074YJ22_AURSE|nr:uncharacterized protein AUEXF2481DRAFT_540288 [Aureobasidium subglaciale EXF-2481]KAI5196011.1 hypothetical protein E4T38_08771 [Aureobasidium subglaciale]KAI5215440.1 hypothetical protein E4T40_08436 [Aureobasidium subglaciale]KAI5217972.1 hypothetical protein E4T41_08585 [Aureobasidium subglaciale]KAI5255626.1 hypothetical protein E4T46_08672 [Aureobasidium subglaciale]KEQ97670.1 hypothetical protein AUEXF2481DRAFT_540288 [Aureobasidium subglaciale EXF-2481]